jgi:hypothetical protein
MARFRRERLPQFTQMTCIQDNTEFLARVVTGNVLPMVVASRSYLDVV